MVVGNGAEGVASSTPLLGHLVHVGRPSVAFQGLVLLAGAPDEKEHDAWEVMLAQQSRGRAEKEPRISIPVPAVLVSELLAGKKPENL